MNVELILDAKATLGEGAIWDARQQRLCGVDIINATAQISNRRVSVKVPEQMGKPDGMTIDADGLLWVALWEGSQVTPWDPHTGRREQSILFPP